MTHIAEVAGMAYLFLSPIELRELTIPNRIVVANRCALAPHMRRARVGVLET
jgi:2,4-dienoyl-CoA reductase-like NADH-dependent reductase (Old Yellow Enzyme family)